MSDTAERLRALYATHPVVMDAADKIEWLQRRIDQHWAEGLERDAEIKRLRALLEPKEPK